MLQITLRTSISMARLVRKKLTAGSETGSVETIIKFDLQIFISAREEIGCIRISTLRIFFISDSFLVFSKCKDNRIIEIPFYKVEDNKIGCLKEFFTNSLNRG